MSSSLVAELKWEIFGATNYVLIAQKQDIETEQSASP